MVSDLSRIVVSEEQIRLRIASLGREVSRAFSKEGYDEITVVCVTNGSILFAADLLRKLELYVRVDCIRVRSYRDETRPVTDVEIIDNIRLDIENRVVLLLDDVLDTGATLNKIAGILRRMNPRMLKTCVLLEKPTPRADALDADFVGFQIPNEFVVGYGLDFAERYRNLPCIGVLRPELLNPPEWQ